MTSDSMEQLVEQRLGTISLPLYEAVTYGLASADSRLRGLSNRSDYPHLTPMLARAEARNYLLGESPPGWRVSGNPRRSGQLYLVNDEHNLELRLLKENGRTHPGGTPPAGHNRARREKWTSAPLELLSRREVSPLVHDPASAVHLLWLWDRYEVDDDLRTTVRVVQPLSPGKFGTAVPIGLSFDIQPNGTLFNQLAFGGAADEVDFFPNIDAEENEEDGLAQ